MWMASCKSFRKSSSPCSRWVAGNDLSLLQTGQFFVKPSGPLYQWYTQVPQHMLKISGGSIKLRHILHRKELSAKLTTDRGTCRFSLVNWRQELSLHHLTVAKSRCYGMSFRGSGLSDLMRVGMYGYAHIAVWRRLEGKRSLLLVTALAASHMPTNYPDNCRQSSSQP